MCTVQMTCGTVYGVVPFVSRRSNGVVCGLVSAGGAIGGVLWQAIFFLMVNTTGNSEPARLHGLASLHLSMHCSWRSNLVWLALQPGLSALMCKCAHLNEVPQWLSFCHWLEYVRHSQSSPCLQPTIP